MIVLLQINHSVVNKIILPYADKNHWVIILCDVQNGEVYMANSSIAIDMNENKVVETFM